MAGGDVEEDLEAVRPQDVGIDGVRTNRKNPLIGSLMLRSADGNERLAIAVVAFETSARPPLSVDTPPAAYRRGDDEIGTIRLRAHDRAARRSSPEGAGDRRR